MRKGDCTPCVGTGCLKDSSARVDIVIHNLEFSALTQEEQAGLRRAYAQDIASSCGIDNSSVVDLLGQEASVTIGSDGSVSAFVVAVRTSSANALALRLYSQTFRNSIGNSTMAVVSSVPLGAPLVPPSRQVSVGAVSLQPEVFVPVVPTTATTTLATTSTSTSTIAATQTSSSAAAGASASADEDVAMQEDVGSSPSWWWFLIGAAISGGAVLACVMATKKRKTSAEDCDSAIAV